MKKLLGIVACVALSCLEGSGSLSRLIEYDREKCIEQLEKATDAELWDVFLKGQSELFFESEFSWIAKGPWWKQASSILEIGSGNGSYLYRLARKFPEKIFKGVEKLSHAVEQAKTHCVADNITFQVGDAEVIDKELFKSADIVLFRLTLQHLNDSTLALENAARYLKPGGHVVIIDTCDTANETSHPITAFDDALKLVAEEQLKQGIGNRKISLDLMQSLDANTSQLSEFYEVSSSNLDVDGKVVGDSIRFEGEQNRKRFFNHMLLFLTLANRTYHVPVDIHRAHGELKEYIDDENAWTSIGMHFLVLRKKGTIRL